MDRKIEGRRTLRHEERTWGRRCRNRQIHIGYREFRLGKNDSGARSGEGNRAPGHDDPGTLLETGRLSIVLEDAGDELNIGVNPVHCRIDESLELQVVENNPAVVHEERRGRTIPETLPAGGVDDDRADGSGCAGDDDSSFFLDAESKVG